MDFLVLIYHRIGPVGVALIITGIIMVYLALKNVIYLWFVEKDFYKAVQKVKDNTHTLNEVIEANRENPIFYIIENVVYNHGNHSDDLKAEVAYLFHQQFAKSQRDITLIKVISAIAPMMGLLGTLLGLSGVFKALGTTSSLATSTILATGIWEAVLTTIMGISLAIPAVVIYYLLMMRLRSLHLISVEYGYRYLEHHPSASKMKYYEDSEVAG